MFRLGAIAVPLLVVAALAPPALAQRGRELFQRECAGCHGPGGEGGRGPTLATPKLLRAPDLPALIEIFDEGVSGNAMPGARLSKGDLRQLALWVQRLGRRPIERLPGDPARGQAIYAAKGGCTVCHAVGGHGGASGPDLSDVGLKRGAAHLRASLTDPEAYIPSSTSGYRSDIPISTNFLQVRAVLADGSELLGVRVNEDTFSIQIRDVGNRVRSLWKADLKQLDKQWGRTPMPSYKEALTPAELDDLVAYLATLRSRD
jgi:putative heme-binding domain-containing protein